MFDYKKLCLMIFAACCMPALNAVIAEIEVWSDGVHYRYVLKDWHADFADCAMTVQQHNDIAWAIQQKKPDVFVLAEDTLAYARSNKKLAEIFSQAPNTIRADIALIHSRQGIDPTAVRGVKELLPEDVTPLACLINVCRRVDIRHDNAECSQLIDVYQWQNLPETLQITKDEIIDDLSGHVAHIESVSDAPLTDDMQTLRREVVADLKGKIDALKQIALGDSESDFINSAMDIRWQLVAAKTVHRLVEWNGITHGFVCEGTRHIEEIKVGLRALGYKPVEHIGNVDWSVPVASEQIYKMKKKIVSGALDVRETFTKIFTKQQPVKSASSWA